MVPVGGRGAVLVVLETVVEDPEVQVWIAVRKILRNGSGIEISARY